MKRFHKQVLLILFACAGIMLFGYAIAISFQPTNFDLKPLEDALMKQLEKFKIPL